VSGRSGVLDLRTYKLKPGAGELFGHILREEALPLLERFGIEVIAHGPSLDDGDAYYLVRSFASIGERNQRLDAFYGSREWQERHREAVLALIDRRRARLGARFDARVSSFSVFVRCAAPPAIPGSACLRVNDSP
jgi:NIPSNAP